MIPAPPINAVQIGPLTIHFYGALIGLAILACYFVAKRNAPKQNISFEELEKIFLTAIFAAIIGARIYHVITNWDYYKQFPSQIIAIWNGGLGIIGGIITAALALYILSKKLKKHVLQITDLVTLVLPLGQSIGRWGNYFNQELYGQPTNLPWGLYVEPKYRLQGYQQESIFHPTFLYESILNLINFFILYKIFKKHPGVSSGKITAIYFINYGIIRFLVELIKLDPDVTAFVGPFRIPQYLSIALILTGVILLKKVSTKKSQ